MKSGIMRHRITIQSKSVTQDSHGQETITWATLATVWAQKRDIVGQEFFESRQMQAEVSTKFNLRYRADITPEMQVVEGSQTYNIVAIIDPDGYKRETVLMCREMVT